MTSEDIDNRSEKVCVVGAGPMALISARALKRLGVPYDQVERHSDVGGIWDIDNPGTPMYETCHYISSRDGTAYIDAPMDPTLPEYPRHDQVLSYIRGFAQKFGLYDNLETNTEVEWAEPTDGDRWIVTFKDGRKRLYGGIMACPGPSWTPRTPDFEGEFSGETMHSMYYRSPEQLKGKRVLVVGLGNSGVDIACDAAIHADYTRISVRRGYHLIPKHICGVPILDLINDPTLAPEPYRNMEITDLIKIVGGDLSKYGFPVPEHELFEAHVLLNSDLLQHLGHGRAAGVAEIERFDGENVAFKDGSKDQFDLIIFATGYDVPIPFMSKDLFEWVDGRVQLKLACFNPDYPTCFSVGLLEASGSPYAFLDQLGVFAGRYFKDRTENPERARKWERAMRDRPYPLKADLNLIEGTNRTANFVNIEVWKKYLIELCEEFDVKLVGPGDYLHLIQEAPVAAE